MQEREVRQRGVTGPEVVERDGHPVVVEAFDHALGLDDIDECHALFDLEDEALWSKATGCERFFDHRQKVRVVELACGEVDRDIGQDGLFTCPPPGLSLPNGLVQRKGAELQDEIALLCKRDEHLGRHRSLLGVLPAHQRLEADHLARGEIDDGLVLHRDLTRRKRVPKVSEKLGPVDRLVVHGGGEDDVVARALALGLIQGGVSIPDEVGPGFARPLQHHGTDARVLFDLGPSEREGLRDHAQESLGHLLGLSRGHQLLGQVDELVAPEAAQCVGGAGHDLKAAR